jgi:hypothetical protein
MSYNIRMYYFQYQPNRDLNYNIAHVLCTILQEHLFDLCQLMVGWSPSIELFVVPSVCIGIVNSLSGKARCWDVSEYGLS